MPVPPGMPDVAVRPRDPRARTVFYLHGFASSGKSTKAAYLADRLKAHGIALECPDFNLPDFRSLTMTRMLDQLAAGIARSPGGGVTLIGSSLGGTLAILDDALDPSVEIVGVYSSPDMLAQASELFLGFSAARALPR